MFLTGSFSATQGNFFYFLFKIIHQLKSEGIGIIYIAHRLEELQNAGKIIRPAYIGVKPAQEYVPVENR